VALNARRAADEARGIVRWLRPEFQDPAHRTAHAAIAAPAEERHGDQPTESVGTPTPLASTNRRAWPPELPEQMRATAEVLSSSAIALSETLIADHFKGQGPWKKRLPQILNTLEAVGRANKIVRGTDTLWCRA